MPENTNHRAAWVALGVLIEIVHWSFLMAVLLFGWKWLSASVIVLAFTVTVISQVVVGGCPLYLLSAACFFRATGKRPWTTAGWLYQRYGVFGLIALDCVFVVGSITGSRLWG